jgi:hypothetical protein
MPIRKHPLTLAHGRARAYMRMHARPGGPLHHLFRNYPNLMRVYEVYNLEFIPLFS